MTASRAARSPGDGSFPPGIFGAFPSSALPVQRQRMMEGGWADAAPRRDPNGDPNYFLAVCAPPPPSHPPPQAACATLCHIRCLGLPVPRPPQARVPCGAGTSPKSNSLLLSPGLFSSLLGHVGPPPSSRSPPPSTGIGVIPPFCRCCVIPAHLIPFCQLWGHRWGPRVGAQPPAASSTPMQAHNRPKSPQTPCGVPPLLWGC